MKAMPVNHAVDHVQPSPWDEWYARWHGASFDDAIHNQRKMRLLVFASLYPNAMQPRHGVFVEERLRHLVDTGRIEATVVAPVPWFPFRHRRFGAYAAFAGVPEREQRYGIEILHPRYPVIPKFGMNFAPSLLTRAMLPVLRKLCAQAPDFDLIDAHYFYPDGVAAARLGALLGKPVVITARGSDVTFIPCHRAPRRQIQWAAAQAAAIVTVSRALKDGLVALDVDPGKATVLRNGVDLERFGPRDRQKIRKAWGLTGTVWMTAGHLIEVKGVHIAIGMLAKFPDVTLLVVGSGPEERRLRAQARQLGLESRVRFVGAVKHAQLSDYYNAADALIHASSREGMPNVVLESLACGTPVVASPFDGVDEVLETPETGEIAAERSVEAMAAAWVRLRERAPSRAATRRAGEQMGWEPVIRAQIALYARALSATMGGHAS